MFTTLFSLSLLGLVAGIIVPLLGVGSDSRVARTLGFLCTIGSSVILALIALFILFTGQPVTLTAYQPFPSFSVLFVLDRLAAFFILIIAVVSGCVAVYSAEYAEHLPGGSRRNLLCAGDESLHPVHGAGGCFGKYPLVPLLLGTDGGEFVHPGHVRVYGTGDPEEQGSSISS